MITTDSVCFCWRKSSAHGDYMIDDLPYNLETSSGEKLLFSPPHKLQCNCFKRVNGWREVGELLVQ